MGARGFHAAARQAAIALAIVASLAGCGDDSDGGGSSTPQGRIVVVTAFPGELSAVLARMRIEDHLTVSKRNVRIGTLGGTPVVVTMTGIGLVNAANTTEALLDTFDDISGVVMSGVAGSPLNIADVAVPTTWSLPDGSTYPIDRRYRRLAQQLARGGNIAFGDCISVAGAEPDPVCLPNPPKLMVGGTGESTDSFNGAFPCSRGDVFGCDTDDPVMNSAALARHAVASESAAPIIQDEETAAVARVAAEHGLPFIAFRAVSDGAGDPLGLPGFPEQFFAYYPLAAQNAAAAAEAFVARL